MGSSCVAAVKLGIVDWEIEHKTSGIRTERVSAVESC